MEQPLWLDAEIAAMHGFVPIRFAHHKNIDKPKNHVLHINNYIEIYVYISGKHKYVVEDSIYDLSYGDIIVINPREVHRALPLAEHPYERFYFLVDVHTFEQMQFDPLRAILKKPRGMSNLISLDSKTRHEVVNMLYEISRCFDGGRDDQSRALSFFLRILDEINRKLRRDEPDVCYTPYTPELLKRILRYIADNTAEIQSTSEIAQAFNITPQYLSSYFSKHIGTPPKTYVQAKKIALAKDMLDGGADVTSTCYDCGFNDCSYFIKVFKKYVGVTPLVYKADSGK